MTRTEVAREWLERVSAAAQASSADEPAIPLSELELTRQAQRDFLCGASMRAAPSLQAVPAEHHAFHFAWPVSSRVAVRETVLRTGRMSRLGYALELDAIDDDEASHAARLTDFELLEVDGRSAREPDLAPLSERIQSVGRTTPPLRLDARGRLAGYGDTTAMLNELRRLGVPLAKRRLQALKPSIAKFWYAWCHAWDGISLAPELGFAATPVELCLHGNKLLPAQAESTRRSFARRRWSVSLHVRTPSFSERPLCEALRSLLEREDRAAGGALAALHVDLRLEALLDLERKLPLFVARDVTAAFLDRKGGNDREIQVWEFDWDGA